MKKKVRLFTLIAIILISFISAQSETIQVVPSITGFIRYEDSEDIVTFGQDGSIDIGRYDENSYEICYRTRYVFSLSEVPDGSKINSVKITFSIAYGCTSIYKAKFVKLPDSFYGVNPTSWAQFTGSGTVYASNLSYNQDYPNKVYAQLTADVESATAINGDDILCIGFMSENESTNPSYANVYVNYIDIDYSPRVSVTVQNNFTGGKIYVDGVEKDSPWTSSTGSESIWYKDESHTIRAYTQEIDGLTYPFPEPGTWIVDENDIWVVGNMETDSGTYNAAHWDGENWNLFLILKPAPLYSIFYFDDDDIWVTTFGLPIHWDGEQWTLYHIQNMGLDASAGFGIWGTSSSNMYFVGLEGSIVHYDGATFRKMESETDVNLKDIDGTIDGSYICTVGYNAILPSKSIALEIVNGKINQLYYTDGLYQEGTYGYVSAVSVKDHFVYFSTPAGIWRYDFRNKSSEIMDVDGVECGGLFVEDHNDIIGYRGGMGFIHFNGEDWRKERYLENHIFSYGGGDYKDGLAVMVGYTLGWQAIIARGHHQ